MISTDDRKTIIQILKGISPQYSEKIPAVLYKYRSLTEYTLQDICNCRLSLSKPSAMNDRLDSFMTTLPKEGDIDDIKELLPNSESKMIQQRYDELNQMRAEFARDELRVTCLSENNNNNCMWAHYADGNKGILIAYDTKMMNRNLLFLFKVLYISNEQRHLIPRPDVNDNRDLTNNMYVSSLVKTNEWEYEKEWRVILMDLPQDHPQIIMPKPMYICLGANCKGEYLDEQQRKWLLELLLFCRDNSIQLKRLTYSISSACSKMVNTNVEQELLYFDWG